MKMDGHEVGKQMVDAVVRAKEKHRATPAQIFQGPGLASERGATAFLKKTLVSLKLGVILKLGLSPCQPAPGSTSVFVGRQPLGETASCI